MLYSSHLNCLLDISSAAQYATTTVAINAAKLATQSVLVARVRSVLPTDYISIQRYPCSECGQDCRIDAFDSNSSCGSHGLTGNLFISSDSTEIRESKSKGHCIVNNSRV